MTREPRVEGEDELGAAPVEYGDWHEALADGALLGVECEDCGHVSATPKRGCIECGSRDLVAVELPQSGEVHSETTIAVPPDTVEETDGPYRVGVVDLGPTRLLARIDEDSAIGDTVAFSGTVEVGGRPGPRFEGKE